LGLTAIMNSGPMDFDLNALTDVSTKKSVNLGQRILPIFDAIAHIMYILRRMNAKIFRIIFLCGHACTMYGVYGLLKKV